MHRITCCRLTGGPDPRNGRHQSIGWVYFTTVHQAVNAKQALRHAPARIHYGRRGASPGGRPTTPLSGELSPLPARLNVHLRTDASRDAIRDGLAQLFNLDAPGGAISVACCAYRPLCDKLYAHAVFVLQPVTSSLTRMRLMRFARLLCSAVVRMRLACWKHTRRNH